MLNNCTMRMAEICQIKKLPFRKKAGVTPCNHILSEILDKAAKCKTEPRLECEIEKHMGAMSISKYKMWIYLPHKFSLSLLTACSVERKARGEMNVQ